MFHDKVILEGLHLVLNLSAPYQYSTYPSILSSILAKNFSEIKSLNVCFWNKADIQKINSLVQSYYEVLHNGTMFTAVCC